MESPWKGLSDMDVARATMGQGRPNADQISLPKRSFVGAPPRGEAFQSRIALVRGGAPLLPIGSVDA